MKPVNPQLLNKIFRAALNRPIRERADYVSGRCAGNDPMLEEVNRLLTASTNSDKDISASLKNVRRRWLRTLVGNSHHDTEDLSGQQVGPWRIDRPLARGGLASIYVAHRDDGPRDERVAFKVLRRGLDTDDVIMRFRTERQILASLQHPAISRLLDGGRLPDGRPYLVLEYVDGTSITEHCEAEETDARGRLGLIIDMLHALDQAHEHQIVHRDIKPSNVMVTTDGRVKLLDFGIAKLLDRSTVPGASTWTPSGVAVLTPGYGSPEQHAGLAVTTASDIYQVGGVLYELLYGKRPPTVTADTQLPPQPVARANSGQDQLNGDLDDIVRKAMHFDPSQRYGSAVEMAADLRRLLER